MVTATRKPASIDEILVEEFMAAAMAHELCNQRRAVTAPTALILARVFGNSPDFRLDAQRHSDLWEALHSPPERERIDRARPLTATAQEVARDKCVVGFRQCELATVLRPTPANETSASCFAVIARSRLATKQSRTSAQTFGSLALDCFVASAPRNDEEKRSPRNDEEKRSSQ